MTGILDKYFKIIVLKMLKELKEGVEEVKKVIISKMEISI